MRFEIRNRPDFACLSVTLGSGEQVMTETGAMMGMSTGLKMDTNMPGGIFGAAKRMLGGESVFWNTYTATADGQRLDAAPSMPGDMEHIALENSAIAFSADRSARARRASRWTRSGADSKGWRPANP
jgi:uncharacterized protein (AIM24 family)